MSTIPRILIVDDDYEIRTLLAQYLERSGFFTLVAEDGVGMARMMKEHLVDLVILDLTLPGKDGLSLCHSIREFSDVPIIMLTARGKTADRILGLETGADDYVTKPFDPLEIVTRIRTVLRRGHSGVPSFTSKRIKRMKFSDWVLDVEARNLLNSTGMVIMLSGAEFQLLKIFLDHPLQILNRTQIFNLIKGREFDPYDRSIDLQISRLRQKLNENVKKPTIIKTIRNEGYVLTVPVVSES